MFDFETFWGHIVTAHGGIVHNARKRQVENLKKSAIQPLVNILRYYEQSRFLKKRPSAHQINRAIESMTSAKRLKYKDAVAYARTELKISPPVPRAPKPQRLIRQARHISPIDEIRQRARQLKARNKPYLIRGTWDEVKNGDKFAVMVHFFMTIIAPQSRKGMVNVRVPIYAASGFDYTGSLPDNHSAATLTSEIRSGWAKTIAERWGGAVFYHKSGRTNERTMELAIHCEADFVSNPSLSVHRVYCVSDNSGFDGTVDTMFWGDRDGLDGSKSAIAHEFGHLIGNPDEYDTVQFRGMTKTNWGDCIMRNEHGNPASSNYWLIGSNLATILKLDPRQCFMKYPGNAEYRVSLDHPFRGVR